MISRNRTTGDLSLPDLKSLSASLDRSFFLFVDLIFSVIDKLLVPLPIVLELFLRLRPGGSSPGELLDFELFMTRLGSSSRSLTRLSSELELEVSKKYIYYITIKNTIPHIRIGMVFFIVIYCEKKMFN